MNTRFLLLLTISLCVSASNVYSLHVFQQEYLGISSDQVEKIGPELKLEYVEQESYEKPKYSAKQLKRRENNRLMAAKSRFHGEAFQMVVAQRIYVDPAAAVVALKDSTPAELITTALTCKNYTRETRKDRCAESQARTRTRRKYLKEELKAEFDALPADEQVTLQMKIKKLQNKLYQEYLLRHPSKKEGETI